MIANASVDFDEMPDPLALTSGRSILDRIKAAAREKATVEREPLTVRPNVWPEWRITYRMLNGQAEVDTIIKGTRAAVKKDTLAASRAVLARCCIGLEYEGEQLTEDDGSPSTFASKALLEMFDTARAIDVVTAIYSGNNPEAGAGDGDIRATSDRIVELSLPSDVWVEESDEKDPTTGR